VSGARYFPRLAGLVLGLGVALGVVEIGLRVTGWEPAARRSKRSLIDRSPNRRVWYDCYASNPNGEFRSLPDVTVGSWLLVDNLLPPAPVPFEKLRETPWCVEYELSSQGLRDKERAADAVPGVVRVALVGDSFVFGEGVPPETSLPARLQSELGPSFEVLNLGWPGDDTKREVERLSGAIASLHLRRAVVVFIANDVPMTPELQREQDYIHDLVQYRDAYEARSRGGSGTILGSRLLYLLGVRFDMRRVTSRTIRWYRDLYDPSRNAPGLGALQASLAELAKLQGCRVVLALYPLLEGFESAYPLQSVHDSVAAMARSAGLDVVDLAPAFAGRRTESLWVHPSDHHPNGSAHALAARALVEGLRGSANGFLAP
jgi:hypothetical protein